MVCSRLVTSAITLGLVIGFPSHLKEEGNEGLLVCLFITSFSNLQVNLRSFLAFSNLLSYYIVGAFGDANYVVQFIFIRFIL